MATAQRELCDELQNVSLEYMPSGGCIECLEMGDTWVHLRYCVTCNETRCCDDSKNTHARKHGLAVGHPVIRSKEPGEAWAWCYEHGAGTRLTVSA